MNPEDKDQADKIVELYAAGEIGPDTCARLLAIECARDVLGMSEEELVEFERMLEIEAGK